MDRFRTDRGAALRATRHVLRRLLRDGYLVEITAMSLSIASFATRQQTKQTRP